MTGESKAQQRLVFKTSWNPCMESRKKSGLRQQLTAPNSNGVIQLRVLFSQGILHMSALAQHA